MAANGISTLSTKQAKQVAKLDIAQAKRQGKTVSVGITSITELYAGGLGVGDVLTVVIPAPTQPSGVQATATAVASGGPVVWTVAFTITNSGSGYRGSVPVQLYAANGGVTYLTGWGFRGDGGPVILGSVDSTKNSYRYWNTYDVNELPAKYVTNTATPGGDAINSHRPWKTHT